MNTKPTAKWLIRAFLLLFVLLVIYPVFFVLLTSLKSTSEFYNNIWLLPKSFAFDNYAYAWNIAKIGDYFVTSVVVVSITMVCTLILGAFAGYGLAKLRILGADLIVMMIFLVSMLPSESILMPAYLLVSRMGFTGSYASLIIPYISWGLPLCIYIYRNFFKTVPVTIIEAARVDGCTETGTFLRIVLPLVVPATATNAIFIFLGWWGEMLWSSVELSASALKTLPLGITAFMQSAGTNWGPLCAASAIVLVPVIAFFLFTQKYFVAGLTGGAVKG